MEALFWIFIGGVLWTYVGYPLLLLVLARFARRNLTRAPFEPSVSLVIAAYNEENDIRQKLTNSLQLDYPRDKLQIIVASDCSTDRTHDIVREFENKGVALVILPERGGKTAAQNAAVKKARGEIIVFTDATTQLHRRTVKDLVGGFADPQVGCIGAELEYVTVEGTAVGKGGTTYWRYEKKLKELESTVNSLTGVSGCLYAIRASVYTPIDPDLISDFVVTSEVFAKGYTTAYACGAIAQEKTHEDTSKEFDMRVRIAVPLWLFLLPDLQPQGSEVPGPGNAARRSHPEYRSRGWHVERSATLRGFACHPARSLPCGAPRLALPAIPNLRPAALCPILLRPW